jgi:murein DD-endopeptidase MepM/ murein hydrolase activator NlpD
MATLWEQFRSAQLRAQQLSGQIGVEKAKRAQLERQIAAYTTQIGQAEARRTAEVAQLATTDARLAQLEAGIRVTSDQAEAMKRQVSARTVEVYKQGPVSYLGLLLSANSFRDFLSRLAFVGKVVGTDRAKVTSLDQLTSQLAQEQAEARQRRAEIAVQKAAVEAESARIRGLRVNVTQTSQTLAAELTAQQALLKQVEQDKATYVQAMAVLAGESSAITSMLRGRQISEAFGFAGKKLPWPVSGAISSPFGPRINPIFFTPEFHTGIDIAVDYGTPILAVWSGQVLFAGPMQGYGNVVIIDHGGALATLYAHMSSVAVRQGQTVGLSQRLGDVGCTGLCTGPHLHFETRIGGAPVQPLNLLP